MFKLYKILPQSSEVAVLNSAIRLGAHLRPPIGSMVWLSPNDDWAPKGPLVVTSLSENNISIRCEDPYNHDTYWYTNHVVTKFISIPEGYNTSYVLNSAPWPETIQVEHKKGE